MPKSRVRITNKLNLSELPMTIPCPNDKCDSSISFKVSDVEAKKTVKCENCGVLVNFKPTE
jgi:transcription elongation factor Elf1